MVQQGSLQVPRGGEGTLCRLALPLKGLAPNVIPRRDDEESGWVGQATYIFRLTKNPA